MWGNGRRREGLKARLESGCNIPFDDNNVRVLGHLILISRRGGVGREIPFDTMMKGRSSSQESVWRKRYKRGTRCCEKGEHLCVKIEGTKEGTVRVTFAQDIDALQTCWLHNNAKDRIFLICIHPCGIHLLNPTFGLTQAHFLLPGSGRENIHSKLRRNTIGNYPSSVRVLRQKDMLEENIVFRWQSVERDSDQTRHSWRLVIKTVWRL